MVLKSNEIPPFIPRYRSLEVIMLSKISQAPKINPARAPSCVKSKTFELTETERIMVVAVGDVGIGTHFPKS